MKTIKKVAVSPIPATSGAVIDSFNATDKTTNAPSIRAVEDKLSYSTEEKQIGYWFDGKPLYRKCFKSRITGSLNSWAEIEHNIANVDMILIKDFYYEYSKAWYNAPNDIVMEIGVNSNIYKYYLKNVAIVGVEYIIILEYTKTTDV